MRVLTVLFASFCLVTATISGAVADVSATFSNLGSGSAPSIPGNDADVRALTYGPDGMLYAGGDFEIMGGVSVNGIAKWDGSAWSALGTGTNGSVLAIAFGPDGTLYAGGDFTTAGGIAAPGIATWNGSTWSAMGAGITGTAVHTLLFVGSTLYIGGNFTAVDSVSAANIAKWDGSTWSALGAGVSGSSNLVLALESDGSGGIYAGGDFTTAGGTAAAYIARWNGTAWSALTSGTNAPVRALELVDNVLYVGGGFSSAGGYAAGMVAAWTGLSWVIPAGSELDYVVHSIAPQSDGTLIAGGAFTEAQGQPMLRLAQWNGSSWSQIGSGVPGTYAQDYVGVVVNAPNGSLIIGGQFAQAGGVSAANIAQVTLGGWSSQAPPPVRQGVPLNSEGSCTLIDDAQFAYGTGLRGGWQRAWQEWMVNAEGVRTGGWGCSRTLRHTGWAWIIDNAA